jgi:hypothetical protein
MHISGDNFQYGRTRGLGSYYFSRYPFVWGWATWRRAWKHYDFDAAPAGVRQNAWAAQWVATVANHGALSVVPNENLVTNIGFGPGATHTTTIERYSHLAARDIEFPLRHPNSVVADEAADRFTYYANFRNIRFLQLMPLYRAWDSVYAALKQAKRWLFGAKRPQLERRS